LLDYRIEQGRTDNVLSSREMTGHTRFEWDRTENQFLFNETRGKRDKLRDVDFEWEDSLGLGYKWVERKDLKVKVDIGGNYLRQRFTDGDRQEHYALRLGESLDWKISEKLAFDQLLEIFPRFTGTENNFIRFEANLKYFLTGRLYFGLTVREVYDPEPAKDISPHDLTVRSFFGYEF
jgi:putative salt-induced outer membrane protein YdiY